MSWQNRYLSLHEDHRIAEDAMDDRWDHWDVEFDETGNYRTIQVPTPDRNTCKHCCYATIEILGCLADGARNVCSCSFEISEYLIDDATRICCCIEGMMEMRNTAQNYQI